MTCPCNQQDINYPPTGEWGPLTWTVLHGLAEKAGLQQNILVQNDELRSWYVLLNSIENMLPCTNCREHYKEWFQTNKLPPIKKLIYTDFNLLIRRWLFNLHNTINTRTNKPLFIFSDLSTTYSGINIRDTLKMLDPVIHRAIQLSGLRFAGWNSFDREVRKLLANY
jgi:hypothetical protein